MHLFTHVTSRKPGKTCCSVLRLSLKLESLVILTNQPSVKPGCHNVSNRTSADTTADALLAGLLGENASQVQKPGPPKLPQIAAQTRRENALEWTVGLGLTEVNPGVRPKIARGGSTSVQDFL